MENIKAAIGDWTHDVKSNAGWLVALGVLTILAGILSMGYPWASGLGVTVVIGFVMVIAGIVLAFKVKPVQGWGWMLFSACMGLLLGLLLLWEWPLSGIWAIGTLVGINLVFTGFSIVSVGSAARKLATA